MLDMLNITIILHLWFDLPSYCILSQVILVLYKYSIIIYKSTFILTFNIKSNKYL